MKTFLFFLVISSSAFAWNKAQFQGMNYLIHVPAPTGGKPASLMLSLHGCTQHAQDLAELANWEATAEAKNMIVVLPEVPNGGVLLGCWDYFGKNHTDKNRHNGPLIALTESLVKTQSLNIDSHRVFVSGLSSGSSEAAVLACLRPDLYSGVGLISGPAIGTDKGDLSQPKTTTAAVVELCLQLAGNRAQHFANQVTSVIISEQDSIVNTQHSVMTTEALQKIYGVSSSIALDLSKLKGTNTQGSGVLFQNAKGRTRISFIKNRGLGHAFPSGKGTGRTEKYINPLSIDYPAYLGELFEP